MLVNGSVDMDDEPAVCRLETTSPSNLVRLGWSATALRPGDRVSIVVNPHQQSWEKSARLLHVTLIDTGQDPAPSSCLLRRARGSTLSANPRVHLRFTSSCAAAALRRAGSRENAGYVRNRTGRRFFISSLSSNGMTLRDDISLAGQAAAAEADATRRPGGACCGYSGAPIWYRPR